MSDLSFFDPPIEIAAASPRLEMIASRLKASGMRPYPASDPIDFSAPDPLLIDVATARREVLRALSRAAMIRVHRQVVLFDTQSLHLPTSGEAVLVRRDEDLGALKSRLMAIARRSIRLREAEIRRETAGALGIRIPPADLDAVPSLLYIGAGSPLFLSLQGPLKQRGIEVAAAISRDTALRYMAEHRFGATLVDLDSFEADETSTTRWITEQNGLSALPMMVLTHPEAPLNDRQTTVISMATEVIDTNGQLAEMVTLFETACRRLTALAPVMPRPAHASILTDYTTGLFSRQFLKMHINRQMDVATQRAEPLCVLTFQLDPPAAISIPAQKEFADILRASIRESDCPALLSPGTFAITLPSTPFRGGVRMAERISDFAAQNAPLVRSQFGWRVIERRAYHTAQMLLGAGTMGHLTRPRFAA